MNKKRLLILSDWFIPAVNAGGPVRSVLAIVEALKEQFDISVLTSDRDFRAEKPFSNIKTDVWLEKEGYRCMYLSPKQLLKSVRKEVEEPYHKIYLNSLFSKCFTLEVLRKLSREEKRKKVILAPRGMLAEGALGLKSFKKKSFLKLSKWYGLYKGVTWHASSQIESDQITKVFPGDKVKVLQNLAILSEKEKQGKEKGEALEMVTIARISPVKNLFFVLQCITELKTPYHWSIYGPIEDREYYKKCRAYVLKHDLAVSFKGEIPSNKVAEELKQYNLFVLPTLGENFGHAIAESLQASLPVIISDKTPWLGLKESKAGYDLPLDNKREWIRVIDAFSKMGNDEYARWREGAWKLAEQRLNNKELLEGYVQLFS